MKRAIAVILSSLFALLLCSCGSNGGSSSAPASATASASDSQTAAEPATTQEQEYDPAVDSIDLALDGGIIRFDHVERANAGLTDSENALVFVFEFTNEQNTPASVQSVFRLQFFQNGTELTSNLAYSSEGGDQFELVSAFMNDAMKGGSVTFGTIVEAKDDSPITIMAAPNGYALEDNYQTMEVAIDGI